MMAVCSISQVYQEQSNHLIMNQASDFIYPIKIIAYVYEQNVIFVVFSIHNALIQVGDGENFFEILIK